MSQEPVFNAHGLTIEGLLEMIANPVVRYENQPEISLANLKWMCETILGSDGEYPDDKEGRWVGFVQGVLAARGVLSVALERDRTRPFFHEAYEALGIRKPPTRSMDDA